MKSKCIGVTSTISRRLQDRIRELEKENYFLSKEIALRERGGTAQDRWDWSRGLSWRCEISRVYGLNEIQAVCENGGIFQRCERKSVLRIRMYVV